MPWNKSKIGQLDLVDDANDAITERLEADVVAEGLAQTTAPSGAPSTDLLFVGGAPLLVPVYRLEEDPGNPRTEFPDEEIAELAQDIALRGILQPIVVRRAGDDGLRARDSVCCTTP